MKPLQSLAAYYGPGYAASIVYLLEKSGYRTGSFLKRFWTTQDFSQFDGKRPAKTPTNRGLVMFVLLGALLQCLIGLTAIIYGNAKGYGDYILIGLGLIIAYPLVWAHLLAVANLAIKLVRTCQNPKAVGRELICTILESQVKRLRKTHKFNLVAVSGSIGKTSTKLAVAHILEASRRVIYQTGNYNDRVTVPLVLFGRKEPNIYNVLAWLKIFVANERSIRREFYYDVAVVELGTDHPGQMADFAYLQPDLTVITAITPEHMEYFGSMDAVAIEELAVCDYSDEVLANADDAPGEYLQKHQVMRYGLGSAHNDAYAHDYKSDGLNGGSAKLVLPDGTKLTVHTTILGEQGVKITLAAAAAAQRLGLSKIEIEKGLAEIRPFAGRMQILSGVKNATIIDDTYNASPAAVIAGLDVLYGAKAKQRIAILGSMNELGDYTKMAHTEVGEYCDPTKLDLVITIGRDAKKYLAPEALSKGCKVITADSPYEAGSVALKHLQDGAVILAEGSQNRVFAEEALKSLLKDKQDARKLVRQSDDWLGVKKRQFPQS